MKATSAALLEQSQLLQPESNQIKIPIDSSNEEDNTSTLFEHQDLVERIYPKKNHDDNLMTGHDGAIEKEPLEECQLELHSISVIENESNSDSIMKDSTTQIHSSSSSRFQDYIHELDCIWMKPFQNATDTPTGATDAVDVTETVDAVTHSVAQGNHIQQRIQQRCNEHMELHNHNQEEAIQRTKELLSSCFESILSQALEAFHRNDTLEREVSQLSILVQQRLEENQRLKEMESKNRTSLNHLLQTFEQGKQTSRDISQHVQIECRLRNDLSTLRLERDTLKGQLEESQNKISVLEEEMKMVKGKMTRLMQEKIKMERESRAALSLAMSSVSVDGYHKACDGDYYKRKIHELNDHLSSKNVIITDLQRQVEEYKRQMERSMSQNRLAVIRSESSYVPLNPSTGKRRR